MQAIKETAGAIDLSRRKKTARGGLWGELLYFAGVAGAVLAGGAIVMRSPNLA